MPVSSFWFGEVRCGRLTCWIASLLRGLVFFGFPLHAAGRPGSERGQHLAEIELPMLFLQGSRDTLAEMKLLKPLCAKVKHAELFVVEGGDHSFHMLKSAKRSDEEALDQAVKKAATWMQKST